MQWQPLTFRGARWDFSTPLIMGVLNVTPDSFSDGGVYFATDDALRRAQEMVEQGADCIDIGAESTRPGAPSVCEEEELGRLLPVLEGLAGCLSVPISVDTSKAAVARAAAAAGAELINDVSGGRFDAAMIATVSDLDVGYVCGQVLGSNLAEVHRQAAATPELVIEALRETLCAMPASLRERVIVDPCLGFGKRLACNIGLMQGGGEIARQIGRPVLIGASRKRFLGELTGLEVSARDAASLGAHLAAIAGGAQMVRTHRVEWTRAALDVFLAQPGDVS